eukprot:5545115-Pyramimonas_sp.AAC.1
MVMSAAAGVIDIDRFEHAPPLPGVIDIDRFEHAPPLVWHCKELRAGGYVPHTQGVVRTSAPHVCSHHCQAAHLRSAFRNEQNARHTQVRPSPSSACSIEIRLDQICYRRQGQRGEKWEKVGNWTRVEKRGRETRGVDRILAVIGTGRPVT